MTTPVTTPGPLEPTKPSVLVLGYCFQQWLINDCADRIDMVSYPGGAAFLSHMIAGSLLIDGYEDTQKHWFVVEMGQCKVDRATDRMGIFVATEVLGMPKTRGWCSGNSSLPNDGNVPEGFPGVILTYDQPLGSPWEPTLKNIKIVATASCAILLTHNPGKIAKLFETWDFTKIPKEKCVIVMSAQTLRSVSNGCSLSHLSWEAAADDLRHALSSGKSIILGDLELMFDHIIIALGPDAVLYVSKREVRLLCIVGLAYAFRETSGTSRGFCDVFAAGLATRLSSAPAEVIKAIKAGVVWSSRLCDGVEIESVESLDLGMSFWHQTITAGAEISSVTEHEIPALMQGGPREPWSLLANHFTSPDPKERADQAFNIGSKIVEFGLSATAKESGFLFARVGEWVGVDRKEIEGYQNIRRLIREYVEGATTQKPLCLAVFGSPGSGKSRGIEELTKSLCRIGLNIQERLLAFNMAEYRDSAGLASALHHVRDRVLSGKTPIVMFDEFDSTLGGAELGWLKYFLAPMQSGTFRDGDSEYHTGRAVFVFAGGTRPSFDEFAGQMRNSRFIAAKGPDFVSRLRGHVNVAGLGSITDDDITRKCTNIVRKAIVLRTFLERRLKKSETDKIEVEKAVCKSLLCHAEYRHGVRSLEAVVAISARVPSGQMFTRSSLPPADQLDMHLDAASFLNALSSQK